MTEPVRPSSIRSFRDLKVWQMAVTLVVEIYAVTRRFPNDERFGLTMQLRRASVSVASNIAEGNVRHTRREYRHFISVARGSIAEVETQLMIADRLRHVESSDLAVASDLANQVARMLNRLHARLGELGGRD